MVKWVSLIVSGHSKGSIECGHRHTLSQKTTVGLIGYHPTQYMPCYSLIGNIFEWSTLDWCLVHLFSTPGCSLVLPNKYSGSQENALLHFQFFLLSFLLLRSGRFACCIPERVSPPSVYVDNFLHWHLLPDPVSEFWSLRIDSHFPHSILF